MRTTEINSEALQAAADVIPEDVPVIMLNLIRYKEHADYDASAGFAPGSGREAYFQLHLPAFNQVALFKGVEGI